MFTDGMRKLLVPGVFGAVIAGVWGLGALKADLDAPCPHRFHVDPAIIQAAQLAAESEPAPPAVATAVSRWVYIPGWRGGAATDHNGM